MDAHKCSEGQGVALPRLMIAAPASGSGKTTVTLALLQALLNRGHSPAACKCGPDYIDPLFHRRVLGVSGYNLDLFFAPPGILRGLLARQAQAADIAVLEGVMGYYDGAGLSTDASSWQVARETSTPAVLVLRPGGSSLSAAALVKGFSTFRENSQIGGVLFNGCKPAFADRLAGILERECGVRVYGCLPDLPEARLNSRHLGLVTPDQVENLREICQLLASRLEETADVGGLMALAATAPLLNDVLPSVQPVADKAPIALAEDEAFCFYYRENREVLTALGAEIVPFSPLRDQKLPAGVGGLYVGGGYPELHAKQLEGNEAMRTAIRSAVESGLPLIAECGGFLYLGQQLEDGEGVHRRMVGALAGDGFRREGLGRFGYVTLTAEKDSLLCRTGEQIKAHEFHYWDSTAVGESFTAQKPYSAVHWRCVQANETGYAGFPHLYFWSNLEAAARFVRAAARYAGKDLL